VAHYNGKTLKHHNSEQKIDFLQEKLYGLERSVTTKGSIPSPVSPTAQLEKPAQYRSPLVTNDPNEAEDCAFEGESSLHAHSVFARELLERTIGNSPMGSKSHEMSSAITSLQQLVGKFENQPSSQRGSLQRPVGERRQDLRKLPLPPMNAVLDILRRSKGAGS
jgi:hypothetical protein